MQCPGFHGQIEEWLDGNTLSLEQMAELASPIASALSQLHSVPAQNINLPRGGVAAWISRWNGVFSAALEQHPRQAARLQERLCLSDVQSSVGELTRQLPKSELVLCHNDLLQGNILRAGEHVRFLDYEYAALGERAFDIANHFNEYCGFDLDFSRYPTRAQQDKFLREYLTRLRPRKPSWLGHMDRLRREVALYSPLSHYLWGVWSFIQYCSSPVDFDYLS